MDNKIPVFDIWESNSSEYIIEESVSEVNSTHILAKVVGPAFFPETTSRNNIFYSKEAWTTAIEDDEFQKRLADRLVYGTIGHNSELTDDDIREGKLSHIVTRVWINEDNVGMAEYLVLNTPPGNILNTLLRSGSRLRVSTKAAGFFSNNVNKSGTKAVIPESFRLERIDYVVDPGYHQALPALIESLAKQTKTNNLIIEGKTMDKAVTILESNISDLKSEKTISEGKIVSLSAEIRTISESNILISNKLANYEELGTFVSVQESMSELDQYRQLGSVQDIHEALENGENAIDDLTDTIEELQSTSELDETPNDEDEPSEYDELGTPGDIKSALDQALTAIDELAEYKELGSLDEIQELIDRSGEMADTMESDAVSDVASKFGVDVSCVSSLLDKGFTLDEAESFLSEVKGESTNVTENEEEEVDNSEEEEEEIPESKSSKAIGKIRNSKAPATITESNRSPAKSLVSRLMSGNRK